MKKKKDVVQFPAFSPEWEGLSPIITDPQGCYTGRPIEKYELPVQDADDL